LPVLAMTCGYSRVTDAVMIPSRKAGDILAGMWEIIGGWGRCPRTLVWDREAAILRDVVDDDAACERA
jgi:hypothetical protein